MTTYFIAIGKLNIGDQNFLTFWNWNVSEHADNIVQFPKNEPLKQTEECLSLNQDGVSNRGKFYIWYLFNTSRQ